MALAAIHDQGTIFCLLLHNALVKQCADVCGPCVQLLIGGKFVDATGGATFETLDPRTGEPLMSVAEATAEDVDRAVKAAREVLVSGLHACRLHVSVHSQG